MKKLTSLIVVLLGVVSFIFGQVNLTYADDNPVSQTVLAGSNDVTGLSVDVEYYGYYDAILADVTYQLDGIFSIFNIPDDVTLTSNGIELASGVWDDPYVTFYNVTIQSGITNLVLSYDVPYGADSGSMYWINLSSMSFHDWSDQVLAMEVDLPGDCEDMACGSVITVTSISATAFLFNGDYEDETFPITSEPIVVWSALLHAEGGEFQLNGLYLDMGMEIDGDVEFVSGFFETDYTLIVEYGECIAQGSYNNDNGLYYFLLADCLYPSGNSSIHLTVELTLNPDQFDGLDQLNSISFTASLAQADDFSLTLVNYGVEMQVLNLDGEGSYPFTCGTKTITGVVDCESGNAEFCDVPEGPVYEDDVLIFEVCAVDNNGDPLQAYKYRVSVYCPGGGGQDSWSDPLSIDTPIELSAHNAGCQYVVEIIGQTYNGIWQSEECATSYTWTVMAEVLEESLEVVLVDSTTEFVHYNNGELRQLDSVMGIELTNDHPFDIRIDVGEFSLWYYGEYDVEFLYVYLDNTFWVASADDPEGHNYLPLDYVLPAGESVILSTDIGVWGNGRGTIALESIYYSNLDGSESFFLNPDYDDNSYVNFTVVNPNDDMFNMWESAEEDTLYLFPGQYLNYYYHFNNEWYNSFDNTVMGLTFGATNGGDDSWSYLPNWQVDDFEDAGTLTYFDSEDPFLHYAWNSSTDEGINSAALGYVSYFNGTEYGYDQYLSAWVNLYLYHPLFGYRTEYHSAFQTLITNPGVSGDLSGDNIVDWSDYELLVNDIQSGDLWDTYFNPTGEINASRIAFVMSWAGMFDAWLLNIWLEDPTNYMVANLCIGEEFTYEGCQSVEDRSVEYVIDDNSIELTTDGNIVGVLGVLPDGEKWSTVVQLSDDGLLSWSDDNESIEPVVLENQVSRDGTITLNLPDGLVVERVEAKQLNQFLPGDVNDDGGLDVGDIVQLIDDIFNNNYSAVGDLNNDGLLNVTDVVLLVDSILNIGLDRAMSTTVLVALADDYLSLTSDGSIAGIQFSATGDFQIDQSSLPLGWNLFQNNGQVIMISMDGSELPNGNLFTYSGNMEIQEIVVADWRGNEVPVNMEIPREFNLSSAYPNPFNPVTTLSYSVPEDSNLRITVYDMLGREVTELVSGFQTAGNYQVSWNASNEASGAYLVTMATDTFKSTQKVMLVK